jgi:hypothetical protein
LFFNGLLFTAFICDAEIHKPIYFVIVSWLMCIWLVIVQPPKPVVKPVVKAPVKSVKAVKVAPVKKPVAPESSDDEDEEESSDEVIHNKPLSFCVYFCH